MTYKYEYFKDWYDKRRYLNRKRRTMYSNHRFIYEIDDEFQDKLLSRVKDAINKETSHSVFNTTTKEFIFDYNEVSYVVDAGVHAGSFVYRDKQFSNFSWDQKHEVSKIVVTNAPVVGDTLKASDESFLEFYPKGSLALVQYPYNNSVEPVITFHPDDTRTFSSWNWGPRAMSVVNTVSIYGKRDFSWATATNNGNNNGVAIVPRNNRAYIVTSDSPYTTVKSKRCYQCSNSGFMVNQCNIGAFNRGFNLDLAEVENILASPSHHYENVKVSHYLTKDNRRVYYCQHNQSQSHEDWTNVKTCTTCDGSPSTRLREVLRGLQWSGLPVIIGDGGKVLNKFYKLDLTEEFKITNSNRNGWSDWMFDK